MKERAPYKYLDYYTFEDADLFFGREEETQKMVGEILSTRLLVLFSPSGSGKTSLINAGVRPALEKLGYKTVYVRLDKDPIPSVQSAVAETVALSASDAQPADLHGFLRNATAQAGKPLVVFVDQFEEFFLVFANKHEARQQFIEQVAKIKYDDTLPVFLVFSLREDYFANLHEFREAIPSIFQNNANLRLEPFTEEEAARAIAEPVKQFGYEYDESLVQTLVADLKNGKAGIEPIALQIVCHTLWQNRPKPVAPSTGAPSTAATLKIDEPVYQKCRGVQAIIDEHVDRLLRQIPARQQGLMVRIFEVLKTRDNTKLYRRVQDLQETLRMSKGNRLQSALQKLAEIGVLRHEQRSGDDWYEFKHDYLVPEVTKWMLARKERVNRRRLFYGIAPGIILFLGLLAYWGYQYNMFYASLTNQEYPGQEQEIIISRGFDPFKDFVTTGILMYDVRGHEAANALRNKFQLGFGKGNNWKWLAGKLDLEAGGNFLYKIGERQAGIDTLIRALQNTEADDYLSKSARILIKIGQADEHVIPPMLALLKDQNPIVRSQTAEALAELGRTNEQIISALISSLKDDSSRVRTKAAYALEKLGKDDDEILTALVNALMDDSLRVRSAAESALLTLAERQKRIISVLQNTVREVNNKHCRFHAARALAFLKVNDVSMIEVLQNTLKDKDPNMRVKAAEALIILGERKEESTSVLLKELKNENENIRVDAACALSILDEGDTQIVDALMIALSDEYETVRYAAGQALLEIGIMDEWLTRERAIGSMVAKIKGYREYFDNGARGTFEDNEKWDDQAVNLLISELKQGRYFFYGFHQADDVLSELAKFNPRVIDKLLSALENKNKNVRFGAAMVLGKLGKMNRRIIDVLLSILKNEELYEIPVNETIEALANLAKHNDSVIDTLTHLSMDNNRRISSRAALVLACGIS